jgi:hypothetical protein
VKLYVVQRVSQDYDDYDQDVYGVFSSPELATGFRESLDICEELKIYEFELDKPNQGDK